MKLTQGKIKDYVEPQAYDEVHDFASDGARVLAAYRFTEATSDLLARWLDALADLPRGHGAAYALAGLRGVGKSHALAAFGAIADDADLRPSISDTHVATSARRLTSRRHTVVRVERGTKETLSEELAAGLTKVFGDQPQEEWAGDPAAALARATERVRGATIVLIIDTAFGRASRVSRDDGPTLGALASAARELDAFVALALDDDIEGAEGANVALSQTFRIDYLEPEHLYQVANNYVLRKTAAAREPLHEIYLSLRQTIPNFNWSEPRFSALYPVHPLVAEVAPSVRLHAHDFAFLSFASQAAQRAVSRPALSLVLLDEVFDAVEQGLRGAKDLREAFAGYDELSTKAVAQFPALQRLQVRLILKNLFVLSLDGRGAGASDLCAALLQGDEAAPQEAVARVEETLRRLVELSPPGALVRAAAGEGAPYRFQIGSEGGFEAALAEAVKIPLADPHAVSQLLAALARSRFEDYPPAPSSGDDSPAHEASGFSSDFSVVWRGSSRLGRLTGRAAGDAPAREDNSYEGNSYAWELIVLEPSAGGVGGVGADSATGEAEGGVRGGAMDARPITVVWQPAEMTAEEWGLLRRLHALRSAPSLARFGEAARVAVNTLAARAERVWARLYVDDGAFFVDGSRLQLTDEARSSATLAGLLAPTLAAPLAARYTRHPEFAAVLCEQDAARLVEEFFSGANASDAVVQSLAEQFAVPLGLATLHGSLYAHASGDEAARSPWVAAVLALVDAAGNETVPVAEARRALAGAPYGLRREAQHVVLAALVACGRVELVTASGGRISRRTLGHAVEWDEITGVSRPASVRLGADELTEWARRLTGRDELPSLADGAGRESVREALTVWLSAWRDARLLAGFDELPDSGLTTRSWNLAADVRQTYGEAADAVESGLAEGVGDAPLEDTLQRVADAFGESAEEFGRASQQFEALTAYAEGVVSRETARDYLVLAEPTGVEEIESARRELLQIADDPHTLFDARSRERFDLLWRAFRERYAAYYVAAHERAVGSEGDRRALEELTGGDPWREFEVLADLPFVNPSPWHEAARLARRVAGSRCALPVAELLAEHPRCDCRFRLADAEESADAAARLVALASHGRALYRRTLAHFHGHIAHALEALAGGDGGEAVGARALALANSFARGENPPHVSPLDVSLILRALEQTPAAPPLLRLAPPDVQGLLTRDELVARLRQWIEELPHTSALVEIASEGNTHAAAEPGR